MFDALREAEDLLGIFTVLYPTEAMLRNAMRACAAYQMSWYDAHLWSYADHYAIPEILSEDFEHNRRIGGIRIVNPFLR